MAKKTAKESSLPLVLALVFFVLTTIAFGVLWYMQYSDQQAKDGEVKAAKDSATAKAGEAADAKLEAQILRILIGIEEEKDKESVASQTKGKAIVTANLKKFNDAMAKSVGVEDPSKLPDDLKIWSLDDKGMPMDPPTKGFLPVIAKANAEREAAKKSSADSVKAYSDAVKVINDNDEALKKLKAKFEEVAAALPKKFKEDLEALVKKYDDRTEEFKKAEKQFREDNLKVEDDRQKAERGLKREHDKFVDASTQIKELVKGMLKKQDAFQYDEPQGKVLKRLPDGVVEINLGSSALVRPGLTFTVLPSDFVEKGRQSRMRLVRVANDKGEYKSVERFVEKATIEVIEVLNNNLSRARITSESEPIRDAVGPGDLLYNAAWRKGSADHIALVGIFDLNGDGNDDIETVVRDLTKMGIPVDAYFDLKTRKWKGQIDTQTRFIIQGYSPISTGVGDSRREEKSKLYTAIDSAIESAQSKGGAQVINFRDFFPRMGIRVKLDISPDKINQAASPYLQPVSVMDAVPPPNQ